MTEGSLSPAERARANRVKRRCYAREAPTYDRGADLVERWLFGTEHRGWACSRASGEALEVAIGTGLNIPFYPADVRLLGLDLSAEMLALATRRARGLGREIRLIEGDAQELPLADDSFDTVTCTYALCSIPDDARAIEEMHRVLKPGGQLILVDHVRSSVPPIHWLQRLYELIPSRVAAEFMTRRPALHVMRGDFEVRARDRLRAGIVERLVAVKPST